MLPLFALAQASENDSKSRISIGALELDHQYTRSEVERMMGISRRDLDYWTRLRLVLPRARWGERFYTFSDLVALETIKRLAARHVPASRIRRAVTALQTQLGTAQTSLSMLRISTNGKQVVVYPPLTKGHPYEPLTGQFVLNFEVSEFAKKIHALASRSAEEWFELGMACDSNTETLEQAAKAYGKAVDAAPDWVEARINFGTTLYQLGRLEAAREQFVVAVKHEPKNALAEFNLGCVLQQLGEIKDAIEHLTHAIEIAPTLADAHLNLALAYEKSGERQNVVRHLSLYVRYEPNGPWAEFARSRIAANRPSGKSAPSGKLTPFRRKP
jgi:tetratricopeptide (TPR) repeat protein